MNKEQLVNKFIRCTSQEMQDRVARKLEGMGVVRSIIFSDDLFCIFPQIEVFKTDDGTILFSNCDYENIGDGDNLTEITESDLIRDPRIWVKVAKRFKRWVYPCLAILQYQGK